MISFVEILEYTGTFAFAISGIRYASLQKFDWFGAYVVGLVTAIGGGTLRDLLLNSSPFWMTEPSYLICTAIALLFAILFGEKINHLSNTFMIFDTLGLGFFVVVGIEKTLDAGFPMWTAVVMGAATGAFGGVIRDVLLNQEPLIFRKEIYAMACVIGGIAYWLGIEFQLNAAIIQVLSATTVILTRLLAVRYHIGLPVLKGYNEGNNNSDETFHSK
ncbi:MAG: trimeric intracellular cation channel family protein [Bacteroidales bacterium]|nr:trimeric intracellular cation channel family protein [Bacteroidales bacterium]